MLGVLSLLAISAPEQVTIGAYVNDIQSIDIELHSYAVDITLWFRWRDRSIDPTASLEFVNPSERWGHERNNNYETPVEMENGELYQVVRVQGRFSQKLPLYNYPFDRQELVVELEDSLHESSRLIYVPDQNPVTYNPELLLPGWQFEAPRLTSEEFQYPTNFGDLRQTQKNKFSRVRVLLPIHRPAAAYSVKLLLPVLCVVLCAALMLMLRPSHVDARIGIGITALLTIVALQITTNEDLPDVDYLVLMDKIYIGAYLYVITGLAIVVRTTRLLEPEVLPKAIKLQRNALILTSVLFALGFLALVATAIAHG